jgi:hypothetical protein
MRERELVAEDDAVTDWIDGAGGVRAMLFAASKGTDGVSYWICERKGFDVSRLSRAKESEAQPYFSPK